MEYKARDNTGEQKECARNLEKITRIQSRDKFCVTQQTCGL